ncbi:MAG: alpha/beta hydrolase [Anaerolineae bacterium]|nr:alpha/beta hydrolase [Anaerolineae bacterium]
MDTALKTVTSKDGTTIAYELSGVGPALVLVGAALSDHADTAKLARLLAEKFTVVNYDRRGRGQSSDTPPYAVEREVEDIKVLIDASGGSAFLFGSSSGAVLALEAGSRLGGKINGLFLYEPPFIVDDSRPPMPDDLIRQIEILVAANRRSDAVKLFFTKGMGIPAIFVTMMRLLMPGWSKATGMAHTLRYDFAVMAGTQTGKPLPAGRWASAQARTLVIVGSKSEAFFHNGAKALSNLLPHTQYRALEGRDHGAVQTAPHAIATAMEEFFLVDNMEIYSR